MIEIIWAYLAIGACIASVGFAIQYSPKSKFAKELDSILYPNRSRMDKFKETLVVPVGLIAITLGWPIFVYMIFEGAFSRKGKDSLEAKGPVCATQGKYLVQKVSIEFAEREAIYSDPLNATPTIPFGHLNLGWKKFIEGLQEEDELWSFLIPKGALLGTYNSEAREDKKGYSIVRNGKTVAEFIYEGSGGY